MMKFTVKGMLGQYKREITYENEKLSGDSIAMSNLEAKALLMDGEFVGPINQQTRRDHLKYPLSAYILMHEVFDEVLEEKGDIPKPADVPPDAII